MLIPLVDLVLKHEMEVTGVIHAGAHLGEEAIAYRQCGIPKVIWIEADPRTFRKLNHTIRRFGGHKTVNAVVSDREGQEVTFNIANNGESSSILELERHLREHPEVHYVDKFTATTTTLDRIAEENDAWDCNMLNLDLQGAELLALQGAEVLLSGHINYIYTEVNVKSLYKDCARMQEIDKFLAPYGFTRTDTEMTVHSWGDAFYLRQP